MQVLRKGVIHLNEVLWVGLTAAIAVVLLILALVGVESGVRLGFTSIAIACYAVLLTLASDRRMKAMSNLEFREKIAVMKFHMSKLQNNHSPFHPLAIEGIVQDLRSALELKRWVKHEPSYQEFKDSLREFVAMSRQTGQCNLCHALERFMDEVGS